MWFKNLRIYKLTDYQLLDPNDFADALEAQQFNPCGSLDLMRYGFTPIYGDDFAPVILGFTIFCAKREEKILPSATINEQVEKQARALSEAENRHIGRKERQTLRDEVIFSMLPKAFTKSSLDFAYIDHKEQLLIVNASSAKRAEDFCGKLREALGSLQCIPLHVKGIPAQHMTEWVLTSDLPFALELGDALEFNAGKDGRVIRCKHQDLTADEIKAHISSGMFVTKLALNWREGITFILDDSLAIKSLKFGDSITEQSNERNPESKAEQFDADFAVMTAQLRPMINDLITAFGGPSDGI